ncbi:MAG: ASKHA domain-containing protein [Leptolinea sp.]
MPYRSYGLGLAVDIGTTKIAAYLLNLSDGKALSKMGVMNPQIRYGEDVISRIAFTDTKKEGRRILQECLIDVINELIISLCNEAGVQPQQIVEVVTVGNTAIQHFFAGFPVRQLALSPYVPSVNIPLDLSAHELGLNLSPGVYVHMPANIGGFVGADHVAMMLSTKAYKAHQTTLALDIGTNTEISLVHDGKLICCSCASGPAFEGAHIKHGMRAANGAIERLRILDGQVRYQTIGNQPPLGLCGSGILDAVAELRNNAIINDRGAFLAEFPGVFVSDQGKEFLLIDKQHSGSGQEITISRRDINEILLAKSAIRTGIGLLLQVAGLEENDIQQFIVAGAFGTYLDIESAVTIHMFPDLPRERFKQVGNAAGLGAQMMLVSACERAAAYEFARRMTYIELITQPDFKEVFMQSMYL